MCTLPLLDGVQAANAPSPVPLLATGSQRAPSLIPSSGVLFYERPLEDGGGEGGSEEEL